MTLITNEIHLVDGFDDSFIISTADRRLTYRKEANAKRKYKTGKKLFKIEHLNASLSYWGNTMLINEKGNAEFYFNWLPNFIKRKHAIDNLMDFAKALKDELNRRVPVDNFKREPSGFHFAGYRSSGEPEFIHFSNCKWTGNEYQVVNYGYKDPYADFLNEHAKGIGWDGSTHASVKGVKSTTIFRNGDFRIHEAAWKNLDNVFEEIVKHHDFGKLTSLRDDALAKFVQFKMKFIGDVYSKYADTKLVGGPFDVIILKGRNNPTIADSLPGTVR
ncbi:hypothetical protein [Chryseolinea lacunae]|uniref:Uncharacterized protein n=1 Tax=Chryseolinea lacunae TaxID=2801331 RepID=A0ABS1L4U1_9BACT|nr:hypothetical protein [Chryseolinea lacunae]MBL0745581.1 hypothetical protein [Chryseolinea lacunae]